MPQPDKFPLKVGNVIFCEDVRAEINSKFSIFGAIAGRLIVGKIPANVKASLYVELYGAVLGKIDFEIQVYVGKVNVAQVKGSMEIGNFTDPAIIMIPSFQMHIPKEEEIRVYLDCGGHRRRILTKTVVYRERLQVATVS